MNDMTQTPAIKFQEKMRERASGMTDSDLAAWVSRNMMQVEQGLEEAAQRFSDAAGEDRSSDNAKHMLHALNALYVIKGAHTELSLLQCEAIGVPISTRNER
jgi:hypothetical protein